MLLKSEYLLQTQQIAMSHLTMNT